MSIFTQTNDGFLGDVMPYYWDGKYHAFYIKAALHAKRQISVLPPGSPYKGDQFWLEFFRAGREAVSSPVAHLVSSDLVHWEEWPLVIQPSGVEGDPDPIGCWTGSFIERNGVFHLFYTGFAGDDKPQTTCHATSTDLREWKKDPKNPIMKADPRWYAPMDWRDPIVFWNEEEGLYWMVFCARIKEGPANRRGCLGLATSPDLEQWEIRPPIWVPHLHYAHECPDIFRLGDRWVLLYSDFSDRWSTHYRVSDSLYGPWQAFTEDTLDSPHFYAAKTTTDGKRRFLFGWSPTSHGNVDKGLWEFGGCMVIHELSILPDGRLVTQPVPEIEQQFSQEIPIALHPYYGEWKQEKDAIMVPNINGSAACTIAELSECCRVTARISCSEATQSCGLLIYADATLDSGYQIRWEPGKNRVVFDRWPRPGNEPFMVDRWLPPVNNGTTLDINIHIDGTELVAYLNNTVALTHRIYDHRVGKLGLFVTDGEAAFTNVRCFC